MEDWSVVGFHTNPIPDDPRQIAYQITYLRAMAEDIATQLAALPTDGNIDALEWDSEAAGGFKEVVKKLPRDLRLLQKRYEHVAAALDPFNQKVMEAQNDAAAGLSRAETAAMEQASASQGLANVHDFQQQAQQIAAARNASAPPGTPPVQPEPWSGPDYNAQMASARQALQSASAQVHQAVSCYRQAASTAASAVADASNDALKNNDSIWGFIGNVIGSAAHWVAENFPLKAISEVLGQVAAVAGILSLIPGIGEVFFAISMGAMIVTTLCDAVSALNDAYEGNFGWHDVLKLGADAVAVGIGYGAHALEGAAEDAGKAAETASDAARTANAAAGAATGERLQAEAELAAREANLEHLQSQNIVLRGWNRLIGTTARAESGVVGAQDSLDAAQQAETKALQAVAAADQAHTAAAAAEKAAENRALMAKVAEGTHAGAELGIAGVNYKDSMATLHHLVIQDDDPAGTLAASIGRQLTPQPILAGAGSSQGAGNP